MSHKVLRKGKWKTVDDTDYKINDIIGQSNGLRVKIINYFQLGYDKCPYCKHNKTFHSETIKKDATKPNYFGYCATDLQQDLILLIKEDKCKKCRKYFPAQIFEHRIIEHPPLKKENFFYELKRKIARFILRRF